MIKTSTITHPPILAALIATSQTLALPPQNLSHEQAKRLTVLDAQVSHTGTDACIRKVTDGKQVFILKQINDPSLDEQFLLINDCVASQIGHATGVPINQVLFIPYDVAQHLKPYPERAATLHTYVPGKDLESELPSCVQKDFILQQRVINPNSPWQKKFPLAEHQQGLTQTIIESMGARADIPAIVALDTFVGNSDRSLPNIFYDQDSDTFHGIDQAAAFSKELPKLAHRRIKALIESGYFKNCAPEIIKGLCIYREVLRQLHRDYNPDTIIQNMQQLASHLAPDACNSPAIQARLLHHATIIKHNYSDIEQLLTVIEPS